MIFNDEITKQVLYTPATMQRIMVDLIKKGDSDLTLLDPTNPFLMLLEANVVTTNNAVDEAASVARKLYPSLANTEEDLYHHISSQEEINLFASPSDVHVTFMVNVLDLKDIGVYNSITKTYTTKLQKYTEINISGVTLTLLNDIEINLVDGIPFVEQKYDNPISVNSIGNVYSVITKDVDNVDWIMFETKIKQVSHQSHEFNLISQQPFKQKIPITGDYYYSECYINDGNNNWTLMDITHSDIVYDHTTPTMKVKTYDGFVEYKLPDFYTLDGNIAGLIKVDTYSTIGKTLLPLSKFAIEEFKIKHPKDLFTQEAAVATKIDMFCFSKNILDGGVSKRTARELRKKIIYNTTGTIDLPITEKQLNERVTSKGFRLFKALDTITDRIYIAGKNINDVYKTNALNSNIDIFNNTVRVLSEEIISENIVVDHDIILIKSGTVFETINGVTKILNDVDLDLLRNNTLPNTAKLLYRSEYFFTPFYYMLDLSGDILNSRIYDLDNPEMSYLQIVNKNKYLKPNVNITRYGIFKKDMGYEIYLSLFGNVEFDNINKNEVYVQIALKINEFSEKIYFTATYDQGTDKWVATIESNFIIDTEDRLNILNGVSRIFTHKTYIDNVAEFIIYTTDSSVPLDTRYEPSLELFDQSLNANALCKEQCILKLGNNLNYLWNKINSVYTDRKFLKATEDKYLRYKKDVFNTDVVVNNGVVIPNDNCDVASIKFLHREGDIVLDVNSEPLYEHKVGDILYDEYNNPTVDNVNGIVRFIDIFMLQYEYKVVEDKRYIKYIDEVMQVIRGWLLEDLSVMNDITLEHTQILYKPRKSSVSPVLRNDMRLQHLIQPKVTLYMDRTIYSPDATYSDLLVKIGKIIHKYSEKSTVVISDIKREIMQEVGIGVTGVKLDGITSDNSEILVFKETSNRLSIKKKITQFGEITYDIELKIIPT